MSNASDFTKSLEAHAAFRFCVQIDGIKGAVFHECTLPSLEMEVYEVKEGGLNTGPHQRMGPVKAGRLVLKRGYASSSGLLDWYKATAFSGDFDSRSVSVIIYDSLGAEILRANFTNAIPAKWSGPTLKTSDSSLAIESLELVYDEVTFE
jgi:phage tail-like protein